MHKVLLCTDLDRTLIPNGRQPESKAARPLFAALVASPLLELAYVSGRHKELIEEAIASYTLPLPDYAIADVGSTIYQIQGGEWLRWQHWDKVISKDWAGYSAMQLHDLLHDITGLQLQEPEKQNRFKLSYYLPLSSNHELIMADIERLFQAQQINSNLIWSIDEQADIGLLDILPAGANKLEAIRFLIHENGYALDDVVFAGDSGNDLDVLMSPIQSVLVANASSDVRNAVLLEGAQQQRGIYLAHGAFLNMNGNYSAGILEGLIHYRPDLMALVEALAND